MGKDKNLWRGGRKVGGEFARLGPVGRLGPFVNLFFSNVTFFFLLIDLLGIPPHTFQTQSYSFPSLSVSALHPCSVSPKGKLKKK